MTSATLSVVSPRNRIRRALAGMGGVVAAGAPIHHPGAPVSAPFGTAHPVEHDPLRTIPVAAGMPPATPAFLDGIQRYAVEGRIGVSPVVRAYVAAAALRRDGTSLGCAAFEEEEFLVAPLARLTAEQRATLETLEIPIVDLRSDDPPHPLVDVYAAGIVVERRREALERRAAQQYVSTFPDDWLVVDGALPDLTGKGALARVLGVAKSHETQFLRGADLETALALPQGHRTSVFQRGEKPARHAHTWYLRLWPWNERELLHGLVRLERTPSDEVVREVDWVSAWIMSERAPIAGRDARWDRVLYPIAEVEIYLRARAGAWQ